jgi:hypothetical protein
MATGVVLLVELGRVAFGDPFREPSAVPLGSSRLGHEFVPVMGIGADDPSVAHHEGDASEVEVIFEKLKRPAKVALPAV